MESIIKADIFFFIASIATVCLAVVILFGGYYFVQIMRNARDISRILKEEVAEAKEGIEELEERIRGTLAWRLLFGGSPKKHKHHPAKKLKD